MYDSKAEDDADHHHQQRRGGGPRRNNYNEEKDPESEQFRKLFIGGLSYDTTEEGLRKHFEEWGEIVDCVVMRDPQTKRSRGFGFITYKQAYMVDEAQKNRPHKIDNREVESKRAMPREESGNQACQASVKKIFVGGIKEDTTEDQVRGVFSQFGTVESVEMIRDKGTDKVRGFCFVMFNDYDAVDKAVLIKRHDINGRMVEVKKALSRSEMNQGVGGGRGVRSPMLGRGGGRFGGGRGEWGGQGGGYGGGYGGGNYNQDYAEGRSSHRNGDRRSGYGGGYGSQGGGYGGGYNSGGGGGWNQGGGGGGYDSFGGGYNQGGGNWNNQNNFGSGYGDSYGGGAIKGGGYSQRGQGPYGSGYGNSGGGGGGYGSGGGYGGGYRR